MRRWIWMCLALSACSATPEPTKIEAVDQVVRERGRVIYHQRCAICHGERVDGRGVRVAGLDRPPSDFTSPEWRRSKNRDEIARVIREGRRFTAMPASPTLSDAELGDVTSYVLSVSGQGP